MAPCVRACVCVCVCVCACVCVCVCVCVRACVYSRTTNKSSLLSTPWKLSWRYVAWDCVAISLRDLTCKLVLLWALSWELTELMLNHTSYRIICAFIAFLTVYNHSHHFYTKIRILYNQLLSNQVRAPGGFCWLQKSPISHRPWFFRTTRTADLAARKHSKIVQSAPPARPCTSIVDMSHVHVQCSASMSIPYTYEYAYAKSCLCTCTHAGPRVEAARRHGKAFDIFCMRRNRGSVVLLPTTILALETAGGLGR